MAQLRPVIQSGFICAPHLMDLPPDIVEMFSPRQRDVDTINDLVQAAFRAGRLIDFGDWPNDMIKEGGNRGGPMYTKGVIGHPFRTPWLLYHTWETEACVYLVNLLEPDKPAGGDCEVCVLDPSIVNGNPILSIGDRVILEPDPTVELMWNQYATRVCPSLWRYIPGAERMNGIGRSPESAAAGNALDPLMSALMMLSTTGIVREIVEPSEKLNRARKKNGKPPIPRYERVDSAPYVTAVMSRGTRRGESLGGTHASPAPHIRRGHYRNYASGVRTFVRDALVNFNEDARDQYRKRSHYTFTDKAV